MRVVECDVCGETISAADDEELVGRVKDHLLLEQMRTVKLLTDQRERKRRWWPWRRSSGGPSS